LHGTVFRSATGLRAAPLLSRRPSAQTMGSEPRDPSRPVGPWAAASAVAMTLARTSLTTDFAGFVILVRASLCASGAAPRAGACPEFDAMPWRDWICRENQTVRRMSAILASVAVLAAPVSLAQESTSSATSMLPQCGAWLRIHSGTPDAIMDEVRSAGNASVALSQFEKAGLCAGFVLGISEMLTRPFACIPNSVRPEQVVQAVVDFANRQPETMKDDFGLLVGAALSVAWPCPKDK
jgi:Rap1a immunity proteins